MLNPSIGKLLEVYDSRYQLVIDVARRARTIAREQPEKTDHSVEKPVDLALYDLVSVKCGDYEPPNENIYNG